MNGRRETIVDRAAKAAGARNGTGHDHEAPVSTDPDTAIRTAADVAGISDLRNAGASLQWVWKGWIQLGVVTLIGAEGGTGKTRLAADLVRRVRHRELWPEGPARAGYDGDTVALWVVSDNHHGEMVSLCESFGIADCVKVNAHPTDPYGGVSLETPEDFAALNRRAEVTKPLFVIVDTVGNATDRNLSRQEDAKAFYQPLQILARKQNVAVLCLTHLNAGGTVLGRRGIEKVRTVIRMTAKDVGDVKCRRRLEVIKSNSPYPPAIGITMGDVGNEYDANPPPPPEEVNGTNVGSGAGKGGGSPAKLAEAKDWLMEFLAEQPQRVAKILTASEQRGIARATLYRAKNDLGVIESERTGFKFWWNSEGGNDEIPE